MSQSSLDRHWYHLVFGAILLAQFVTLAAARENPETVAAVLTLQAAAWDSAIVRKDIAAIAGNMTEDFRQIRWNGDVVDKTTFLRDITVPDLVIDPYTVEEFSVRVYGDVALLCGRTRMTGRYGAAGFQTHYRYIDVYVRREGTWKVCSVQITKIPEEVPAR